MPSGRGRRRSGCGRPRSQPGCGRRAGCRGRGTQQDLGVRVLRERLFHRLRELVGGGAGGLQLGEAGEHLRAESVFDQRGLVGVVGAEDLAEPFSLALDAALAASAFEGGLELGAGQPRGTGGRWCDFEEFAGFWAAQAVGSGGEGVQGGRGAPHSVPFVCQAAAYVRWCPGEAMPDGPLSAVGVANLPSDVVATAAPPRARVHPPRTSSSVPAVLVVVPAAVPLLGRCIGWALGRRGALGREGGTDRGGVRRLGGVGVRLR